MNSHLSNEELLAELTKLEGAVSNLMMRQPGHEEYEKPSMLYATMRHVCSERKKNFRNAQRLFLSCLSTRIVTGKKSRVLTKGQKSRRWSLNIIS